MDAILLAGGKGTRMKPLTAITPKPLLQVQGRAILEWSLLNLPKSVDHVMVVVNYLQEQIADYMQKQSIIRDYTLVEQMPEPLGTGHAVLCCQPYLRSYEFLVINGDDLYDAVSINQLASQPLGILGALRDQPSKWGVLIISGNDTLVRVHEKPPRSTYSSPVVVNTGAYHMDQRIFNYKLSLSPRNEYEITDYVTYLASVAEVNIVRGTFWFPIGTPDDFQQAQLLNLDMLIKDNS